MYYADLTEYSHCDHFVRPNTLNVGWLDVASPFPKARPPRWLIEKLWTYSQWSVAQMRGMHRCNLPDCSGPFERRKAFRFKGTDRPLTLEDFRGTPFGAYWSKRKDEFQRQVDLAWKESTENVMALPERKYTNVLYARWGRGARVPRLYLGSAEIRVFGPRGKIYAAPNLLFHYVTAHHYKPPNEFVQALALAPGPPDAAYFNRLKDLDLDWSETSSNFLNTRIT
jgi:hypothetical protein